MLYERSIPLATRGEKVLDLAVTTFTGHGLRVEERTASIVRVAGPAASAASGTMIGGISRGLVHADGGQLRLRAEFDGLRRMPVVFSLIFAPLALLMIGVPLLLSASGLVPWYLPLVPLTALVPIVILVPLLIGHYRRRARRELDTLLHNLTQASASVADMTVVATPITGTGAATAGR